MAQTAVTNFATPGFIGYLAEQRASDVLKAGPLVQNQSIKFGTGLVLDSTAAFAVKLPSAATQSLAGVAYNAFTMQTPLVNDPSIPAFVQGDAVTYMARGVEWVAPETAIAVGDPVYCRFTDGAGELKAGRFRNDADGVAATADRWTITYGGSISAYGVTVNGTALVTVGTIAELQAALLGTGLVATATLAGSVLTITGFPGVGGLTLSAAVGTGGTATLARTATGAAATYKAFLVPNARWLTSADANPDLLSSIDGCKLEINTP